MVTFVVLFSATQSFGGLMGNAFFSTYQQVRTQYHRSEIISHLPQTDSLVNERLNSYLQAASKNTLDPILQQNQAIRSLNQVVTREAQVRAYNDMIALNGLFAIFLLIWASYNIARNKYVLMKQQNIANTS